MSPSKKELPPCEWSENACELSTTNVPNRHQDISIASRKGELRVLCEVLQDTLVFVSVPLAMLVQTSLGLY